MHTQRFWVVAAAAILAVPALAWSWPHDSEEFQAARATIFAEADANHDSTLSTAEFATFKELMERQRAAHHFSRADANSDGGVTLQEMEAMPHPGRGGCR